MSSRDERQGGSRGYTVMSLAELLAWDEDLRPVVVATAKRSVEFAECCRRMDIDLGSVRCRFGDWVVTDYGLECLFAFYPIPWERMGEDWLPHMAEKGWVGIDFVAAYFFACRECKARTKTERNVMRRLMSHGGRVRGEVGPKQKQSKRRMVPLRVRFEIFQRDGFRCRLCGVDADSGEVLEVDHRFPVAAGGTNDMENLWTLCDRCNKGKSDKVVDELLPDA